MTQLLVQADDLAISHAATLGIIDSIRHGIVRNTGLFTNRPDAAFAAEQLRERIGEAVLPAIDAAVAAERERRDTEAGEYAQAWWSKHCASNKHMETTRAAHDDFCRLQAEIRRA